MERVMRCKLQLHGVERVPGNSIPVKRADGSTKYIPNPDEFFVKVKMGAVWEGSKEHQLSENAVFGDSTPNGSFEAFIRNKEVAQQLYAMAGREFYVDFTLVPLPDAEITGAIPPKPTFT